MRRKGASVGAAQGTDPPPAGLGPSWRAGGLGGWGGCGERWRAELRGKGMRLERKGLKVGPALQTRAHTPYSDPVTRVSLALNGGWGVLGPGPEPSALQAPAARLWEVADPTVSTHTSRRAPSPTRTHAPGRARTHTSDIPIVPHVTHGPERATLHTRSRTRAHTRTHKHTRPLGHFPTLSPTPSRSPAKALIDCDTPTPIHRHTHSPHTCQPQTHIHKQGPEKYTRTPSPTLSEP